MAILDSEKTKKALLSKLGCEPDDQKDHFWFILKDTDGKVLSRTCISHGPRHDIGPKIISKMAKQLKLEQSSNLVALIDCTKSRDECIEIIRAASQ
jgi:molybdopterin-binding protein